jgi:hypothetical protein
MSSIFRKIVRQGANPTDKTVTVVSSLTIILDLSEKVERDKHSSLFCPLVSGEGRIKLCNVDTRCQYYAFSFVIDRIMQTKL